MIIIQTYTIISLTLYNLSMFKAVWTFVTIRMKPIWNKNDSAALGAGGEYTFFNGAIRDHNVLQVEHKNRCNQAAAAAAAHTQMDQRFLPLHNVF